MKRKRRISPTWQFTLLLTVVVPALVIGYAGLNRKRQSPVQATTALVSLMTSGIATYERTTWSWQTVDQQANGPLAHCEQLWDLNHDGVLDGRPSVIGDEGSDGGFSAELIASGYQGPVAMLQPVLKKYDVNASGQVVDSWGHPLRIAYAAQIYGSADFGVWSCGPDGIDQTGDDITSWSGANTP